MSLQYQSWTKQKKVRHIGDIIGFITRLINDRVHINFPERGSGEILLQIYDLSGRQLFSQPAHAGDNSLDLSAMKPGTYLLKIVSDGRPAGIRKIIKQ